MSSVVDPLLSTVTLDLLRPKETLGNPEEHFRKVSVCRFARDLYSRSCVIYRAYTVCNQLVNSILTFWGLFEERYEQTKPTMLILFFLDLVRHRQLEFFTIHW